MDTDPWAEKASVSTARQHLASTVVNGKLYAIGGRTASNLGVAAAAVNGNIYVFGGEAPTQTFNNNERYGPLSNMWIEEDPMPTARHGLAAANVNEIFHVK